MDCNHEKVCKFGGKFLTLEEDEYYKYLEISNKVLSGTLGNNLLNLQFPLEEEEVGGRQQILMALRDSELNDETLLDTYYDLVIDTYDEAGNYLILLYLDSYDVMTRTKDNINVDESEEVYKYMLCAICPVTLSKPGLGYLEKEQRIGARIRDWVVGAPETGFLFPAFNDRSTDIHSTLFYTKIPRSLTLSLLQTPSAAVWSAQLLSRRWLFIQSSEMCSVPRMRARMTSCLISSRICPKWLMTTLRLTMMTTIRSFSTAKL